MKNYCISFVIVLLMLILSTNFIFCNEMTSFPSNKSVVLVVADIGSIRDEGNNDFVPTTKIVQINDGKPLILQELKVKQTIKAKIYHEYGLVLISSLNDLMSDFVDLNVINMYKPRLNNKFTAHFRELIFPIQYNNNTCLISYIFWREKNLPESKIIDLKTMKASRVDLDFMRKQLDEGYIILKKEDKLIYKRGGLGEFSFPYIPPHRIFEDIDKLQIICNSKDHLVLKSYYYPDELSAQNSNDFIIFSKKSRDWQKINIKAQIIDAKVIYPYLLCKLGNISPQGINYPEEYTGEWSIYNLETQKMFKLKYQSDSNIVYANSDFLLVGNSNKLLYVKLQNDKPLIDKETIIYEDIKDDIGTSKEIVRYIQGAFLGQKEMPL